MPSEFKEFKQQLEFLSEPYDLMDYQGQTLVQLLNVWDKVKSSNNDTKILDKVMKIYKETMKLTKCLLHYDFKEIKERLSKFNNDTIRQTFTNFLDQTEKLLDQVNYDVDKETTIKSGKQVYKLQMELIPFPTIVMGKIVSRIYPLQPEITSYFLYSYAHNIYARGKTPTDLEEISKKMFGP